MSASKGNSAKKNTATITAQETGTATIIIAIAIKTGSELLVKKPLARMTAPTTAYALKGNATVNQASAGTLVLKKAALIPATDAENAKTESASAKESGLETIAV